MKKERNSNIELLRIISMILIVLSHYTVHNGVNNAELPLGINRFILEISSLGNIGTIIFVLISGYFLTKIDKIKLEKVLRLLLQIVFYSITIYLILIIINKKQFSIINFIKNCFPITFKRYWFASAYLIMYLFSPFLNKLFNTLTRKEFFRLILLNIFIFSILSTLTAQDYYGNELVQFIMFYSIGSYIRRYPNNKLSDNCIKIFLSSAALIILSVIILDLLGKPLANHSVYFLKRTSILTILLAVSLLSIFVKRKEFNNKLINTISGCTFGIYLISDNVYIRSILWKEIFKNSQYVSSNYLLLHLIISITIIMIVCTIIEVIRKKIIETPFFNKYNNKIKLIEEKLFD